MWALLCISAFVQLCFASDPTRHVILQQVQPPDGWAVVGTPSAQTSLTFHVALNQRNLDRFSALFEQITDPQHIRYGEYLSLSAIHALIAPPLSDTERVLEHLVAGNNLSCVNLADAIRCEATVSVIEELFQTQLRLVKHVETGRIFVRQIGNFSIPTAIADVVEFVTPFPHYIAPRPTLAKLSSNGDFAVVPETLSRIYNISERGDKRSSQGVAEFDESNWLYEDTDLQEFARMTNSVINFTNNYGPPTKPGDELSIEASLDVQYIGAVGQGNTNWYWKEQNWMFDFVQHIQNASSRPNVISLSYGWSEAEQCKIDEFLCPALKLSNQQYVERVNIELMKIGSLGISVVVASGDSGCHGRTDEECSLGNTATHPDFPGSSPFVTSVGGTALTGDKSQSPTEPICKNRGVICATGGQEVTATTANNVAEITSGGGFAEYAPRPSYQQDFVAAYLKKAGTALPAIKDFNSTNRGYPDVSALAHKYYIQADGKKQFVDGTSAAAPVWAGVLGLINAHRIRAGKPVVGFANPLLYLVHSHTNGAAFQDITIGDNACSEEGCECKEGFPAIVGWDAATGLGTPNVGRIIQAIDEIDAARENRKKLLRAN